MDIRRARESYTTPDSQSNLVESDDDDDEECLADIVDRGGSGDGSGVSTSEPVGCSDILKQGVNNSCVKCAAALIIVPFAICLCLSTFDQPKTISLDEVVRPLASKFPRQDSRFWATIRAAFETRLNQQSLPASPTVLLLLPKSLEVDSGLLASLSSDFTAFIDSLSDGLLKVTRTSVCSVVDVLAHVSNPSQLRKADRQAEVKKALVKSFQVGYDGGSRCFHVIGIDRLSGEVILGLHGLIDYRNSPYKDAFFILSLTRPPPHHPNDSHRSLEKHVRKLFHSLWDNSLGADEVAALVSRMTGRIAVFV